MSGAYLCNCRYCKEERAPMEAKLRENRKIWEEFLTELDEEQD